MRCVSSLSMLVATALLATAVPRATADRVLVVGADASLLHDRIQAESNPQSLLATFSPAGLAQLAMDAFGLATGNVVWLSSTNSEQVPQISVKSPLQADVFSKVNAYAMVFVDRADADVLAGVDATAKAAYHTSFDLEASTDVTSTKIPSVLAKAIAKARGTVDIQCAGTDTVCTGGLLAATHVAEADVDSVLSAHSSFLEPTVDADRTFALELAQTLQITQAIRSARAAEVRRALYVASFSSVEALSEDKRPQAREVLANQIQQLLAALQTAYPKASGAQIVATTPTHAVRALDSTIAYSRMLTSFKDKVAGSLDDDDDDDSGSSDDDENATTSDVNMEDIAEYQIVLWTSVLLGGALLLVIIAMCNMEPKRDSLLYAKFTTSNAGRKFD